MLIGDRGAAKQAEMALLTSKILTQMAMPLGIGGLSILFGALALVFRRTPLAGGLAMAGIRSLLRFRYTRCK